MPAATLVPGYRQVDSFGPDEDYLDEEGEVSYVTLDLGVVEPTLLPSTSTYRLIVSVARAPIHALTMTRQTKGPGYTNAFFTALWFDIQRPS